MITNIPCILTEKETRIAQLEAENAKLTASVAHLAQQFDTLADIAAPRTKPASQSVHDLHRVLARLRNGVPQDAPVSQVSMKAAGRRVTQDAAAVNVRQLKAEHAFDTLAELETALGASIYAAFVQLVAVQLTLAKAEAAAQQEAEESHICELCGFDEREGVHGISRHSIEGGLDWTCKPGMDHGKFNDLEDDLLLGKGSW